MVVIWHCRKVRENRHILSIMDTKPVHSAPACCWHGFFQLEVFPEAISIYGKAVKTVGLEIQMSTFNHWEKQCNPREQCLLGTRNTLLGEGCLTSLTAAASYWKTEHSERSFLKFHHSLSIPTMCQMPGCMSQKHGTESLMSQKIHEQP